MLATRIGERQWFLHAETAKFLLIGGSRIRIRIRIRIRTPSTFTAEDG